MNRVLNGAWVATDPRVVVDANGNGAGAAAQHSASFAPNLRTAGAISLTTATGRNVRSQVAAIYFHDRKSDQSAQVGTVQDSAGVIVGKNEVLYTNAFTGLTADVRYRFKKAGLSQDVLFRQLPPPGDFSLDPDTTDIEIWTEFLDNPQPVKRLRAASAPGDQDAAWDSTLAISALARARGFRTTVLAEARTRPASIRPPPVRKPL